LSGNRSLLLRQVLLPGVLMLAVLAWLRLLGENAGLYGTGMGAAFMVTGAAGILGVLIWRAARVLDHADVARRESEALLAAHHHVLGMVARGFSLPESLEALLRMIEARTSGMLCSILLLDLDGVHVRHGAAPSLPEGYMAAIDGAPIGPRAGSCGTAAYRRAPVIVEDIATDELWADYRELALSHGLRACWSTPILDTSGKVLGTFALYFRTPCKPTQSHRQLVDIATQTAAVAISRQRKEDELALSETRLRLAAGAGRVGLWEWDTGTNRMFFSREGKSSLGYRDDEDHEQYQFWVDRLHPEDRSRVLSRLRSHLDDPRMPFEAEVRMLHKDGSYRWIFARANSATQESGARRLFGCHIDVTERRAAEEDLRRNAARLRLMARRMAEIEDAERRSINRELHDRIGQNLSALNLNLAIVRQQLKGDAAADADKRLNDAQQLLETTTSDVRDIMAELHPAVLEDYGLLAALRTHAKACSERLGIPIEVEGIDCEPRLPISVELAIYRIVQEALNNIAKHARASRADVWIEVSEERVSLTVTDDGVGFDSASPQKHTSYGLTTMRERAEAVGATFGVESSPGRGTRIAVEASREAVCP
jgi:PAS domain S-box-containing protein